MFTLHHAMQNEIANMVAKMKHTRTEGLPRYNNKTTLSPTRTDIIHVFDTPIYHRK